MNDSFGTRAENDVILPQTRRGKRASGFTLVEIALAVAIIGIACVSLLGLLPAGLDTFKRSMDTTVTSLIAQRLLGEVQLADYASVVDPPPGTQNYIRQYDDEGVSLNTGPNSLVPDAAARVIYHANLVVTPTPKLPGVTGNNQNLALVTVQVANNPSSKTLAKDESNVKLWDVKAASKQGISILTYTSIIAGNKPQ